MTTQKALLVNPEFLPDIWFSVRPLIDKALEHSVGEITSYDILKFLLNGKEFLWVGVEDDEIKSILVAEIVNYPRKRILRIVACSVDNDSNFETWSKYLHLVEDFARTSNCSHLEAMVRKGFTRKLNWEHEYSYILKPIRAKRKRKRRK